MNRPLRNLNGSWRRWMSISTARPARRTAARRAARWLVMFFAVTALGGCQKDSSSNKSAPPSTQTQTGDASHPSATGSFTPSGWTEIASANPPSNLILITLDTTRRDRLSCYGYDKQTTPNLDRIAKEGILFEQARTPVPVTLPAHATMMTGRYPFEHEVRNNGSYALADSARTLAEMLAERGYQTGAIVAAVTVERRFGLAQGFGTYDDDFTQASAPGVGEAQRTAPEVTRLALEWIRAREEKPFFLWVHYYDPHAPYHPPEPFRSRFAGNPYDGEVASMDAAIGDFLAGLEKEELLDRSILFLAADHGEGLGEHNELTHCLFVYGTTQRIPWIVRFPKSDPWKAGRWRDRRVTGLVSLIDLLPTAWNALGFSPTDLPRCSGMSLLPLIEGTAAGRPWVYHETLVPDVDYGMSDLRALETAEWKYIRAPEPELFNLKKDPDELHNLATSEKARVSEMENELAALLRNEGESATADVMDETTREKLRSLGYLGSTAPPVAKRRADPKQQSGVARATAWAQTLAELGRLPQALAVIDSLLAEHPETRMALRLRGQYLSALERGPEAVQAYQAALADCQGCPDELALLLEQANAHLLAGSADEALRQVRVLIEARPAAPGAHLLLGDILQRQNDAAGARAAFREEARIAPHDAEPFVRLGKLEASLGRTGEAEAAYREALRVSPAHADALVLLSELLAASGRAAEAGPLIDRALAVNPRHAGANYRRAWALRQAGRKEEALNHYQAAIQGLPTDATVFYELGSLYAELGRAKEAENAYRSAIDTGHASAGAYANLGVMAGQAGRLSEAVDLWRQALERHPSEQEAQVIRRNMQAAEAMIRSQQGARPR